MLHGRSVESGGAGGAVPAGWIRFRAIGAFSKANLLGPFARLRQNLKMQSLAAVRTTSALPRVTFYRVPPSGMIDIEEMEQFALDRLRILREISLAQIQGMKKVITSCPSNVFIARLLVLNLFYQHRNGIMLNTSYSCRIDFSSPPSSSRPDHQSTFFLKNKNVSLRSS